MELSTISSKGRNNVSVHGNIGILGDSISGMAHCMAVLCANKLGSVVVVNKAQAGSFIADQISKIPFLVSASVHYCFVQVGTNDAQDSFELTDTYSEYVALYSELIRNSICPIVSLIPPLPSAYSERVHKINTACYLAATSLNLPVYSPWDSFAVVSGGWPANTTYGDNVHPYASSDLIASETLFNLIKDSKVNYPSPRTTDSSLIENPLFVAPHSGGIATSWSSGSASASSSKSLESIGTLGEYKQVMVLTSPLGRDGVSILSSSISVSGIIAGTRFRTSAVIDMTRPDATGDNITAKIALSQYDGDFNVIKTDYLSRVSYGDGNNVILDSVLESGVSFLAVQLILSSNSDDAYTGTHTAKFSRISLLNLSELSIP